MKNNNLSPWVSLISAILSAIGAWLANNPIT